MLNRILHPGQQKLCELSKAIESWENDAVLDENRNSKTVDDDIKAGIIQHMCPEALRTHLFLNASRLTDYLSIREEIMSYLENKNLPHDNKGTPMEMGSWKAGKSGGKGGKGGKGSPQKT